jgi:hypothetical protein
MNDMSECGALRFVAPNLSIDETGYDAFGKQAIEIDAFQRNAQLIEGAMRHSDHDLNRESIGLANLKETVVGAAQFRIGTRSGAFVCAIFFLSL